MLNRCDYVGRRDLSSVPKVSCRNAKRWSILWRFMRLMSSIVARRVSLHCSPVRMVNVGVFVFKHLVLYKCVQFLAFLSLLRCPPAWTPLIRFTDVCCPMYMEQLRWSVFCCCWATGLEFFAGWTATMWLSYTIQTAFEDSFFVSYGTTAFCDFC